MNARPAFLSASPVRPDEGREIGRSREGRPIRAFRFAPPGGPAVLRASVLAGCHADEPVGPRTLRRLCGWLGGLPPEHPARAEVDWWIVPHANPDGAARNRAWQADPAARAPGRAVADGPSEGREPEERESGKPGAYDLVRYLRHVVRELPGDDMEFGFPRGPEDEGARPENRAIHAWWREAGGPFDLHASLHGMSFGGGPWFLIEPAWRERTDLLRRRCRERARALGHRLHDVERLGEKGFLRLEPGFCTRPDSRAMRAHFLAKGDAETASRFRPSSMEAVRALGGDPLTLVSEMPLFLVPDVGRRLGPPDPAAEAWKARIAAWRAEAEEPGGGGAEEAVRAEAEEAGLRPMPVLDQMDLQGTLIGAGLEQVRRVRAPAASAARMAWFRGGE